MNKGRLAAIAVAAAVATVPSPASAGVSSSESYWIGHLYDDGVYALVTGPPFEDGCRGEGFTEELHLVEPPSGNFLVHDKFVNRANLFELAPWGVTEVTELLDVACEAVLTGVGTVPTPVAIGSVTEIWSERGRPRGAEDTIAIQNSVAGSVTFQDGRTVEVRGAAKFRLTFEDRDQPPEMTTTFLRLQVG